MLLYVLERIQKSPRNQHLPETNIAFEKYMEDKVSFWDRLFLIGDH